ncbi:MAG: FHIPEP family type III secretion protein [Candidatus Eremiobacteraeota bacterium]|nr:FHIPEP family type III secretion protein [Candidatus Eremiobacteraeota bacterium]MBV8354746.1 FHIPEP family type III secretion protein [Candidatus Eremiobacteraeota bacterium]
MRQTYAFAGVVLGIVVVLVIPLPPFLLDLLLGLDILGAALVVLVAVRIEEPLEFSAFAPTLLIATLYRLALDVSATRLILTQGHEPGGVGSVIPAFGAFVVRGNLVVGLIIFAILITIQFVVIASGAQRVAEVAARFTLDAMPGKQMAIDADVHAGILEGSAARAKRARIQREAEFYGAMDGAGKFVKGDAIAALVIVVLNLIGGVVVGLMHAMGPAEALSTFALLSIGNALVTTLPAFLISLAMGLMVTRVAAERTLGQDLALQLLARPDALRGAAGLMAILAFVPALPGPLFATIAVAGFVAAQLAHRERGRETRRKEARQAEMQRTASRRPESALGLVGVDAIAIDLGADLLPLLSAPNDETLLDRIGEIRRALAVEIGIVIPGVRLRDDLLREADTYAIRIHDAVAAAGRLRLGRSLAIGEPEALAAFGEAPVREPVYGLEARAIEPAQAERAQRAGLLVFDPISILGSHLAEVARAHAAALLGRQEFATLLEHLRALAPALLKEVGEQALPVALAHRAFLLLLRERMWPRDPLLALEAMVDAAHTRDPRELAEAARRRLVPLELRRRNVTPTVLVAAPALEERLVACDDPENGVAPEPVFALALRDRLSAFAQHVPRYGAIVASTKARPLLAELALRWGFELEVFSYAELPRELALEPSGMLEA